MFGPVGSEVKLELKVGNGNFADLAKIKNPAQTRRPAGPTDRLQKTIKFSI